MKIIFFTHPDFLGSQSMPRFAIMLSNGMKKRGHSVSIWHPTPVFFKLPGPPVLKKWLGYIDQFIIFPIRVKKWLKLCDNETLFVFTDHALGPWVPLVRQRAHAVHCHDFLAQRSAQNQIDENPTSLTGRVYQNFIWKGYSKGENFISVSNKTREDLHQFLTTKPKFSEVVYNGLNQSFKPFSVVDARSEFGKAVGLNLTEGYILHIGGNQWYKNRVGVIEIYDAWRKISKKDIPLLLIGKTGTAALNKKREQSPYRDDIIFLTNIADEQLQLAYSGATVLLFPSLAEGFGWPIAEAMASGCPVITTNEAPMTEVAGDAAFLIKRRPQAADDAIIWADEAAHIVDKVVNLSTTEREEVSQTGIVNASRFETESTLDKIEKIYEEIIKSSFAYGYQKAAD